MLSHPLAGGRLAAPTPGCTTCVGVSMLAFLLMGRGPLTCHMHAAREAFAHYALAAALKVLQHASDLQECTPGVQRALSSVLHAPCQ